MLSTTAPSLKGRTPPLRLPAQAAVNPQVPDTRRIERPLYKWFQRIGPPLRGTGTGSLVLDSFLPHYSGPLTDVQLPGMGPPRRFNIFEEARAAVYGNGKSDLPPPPALSADTTLTVDGNVGRRSRDMQVGRRTRSKVEANGNWAAGVIDITEDDCQLTSIPMGTAPLVLDRLCNRGNRDIAWILLPYADYNVIVKHDLGEFPKSVLMRLEGDWLNDAIIDYYLNLVQNRHMRLRALNPLFSFLILPTHFIALLQDSETGLRRENIGYNYDCVINITSTANCFVLNSIFIPVNIDNYHWTFVHIDMILKKILYYDSMDGPVAAQKYFTLLRWWLTDEAASHSQVLDLLEWSDICVQDGPSQNNFVNCGVYVIKGIEQLTKGLPLDHSPSDTTAFR